MTNPNLDPYLPKNKKFRKTDKIRDKNNKIFYWEKYAKKPENEFLDKLIFQEIEPDKELRGVIRNLERRIIGKRISLNEISPKNTSVKRKIKNIRKIYPDIDSEDVEDLLDTYRSTLKTRSKEEYKAIVALLVLSDYLIIINANKDPSLAELDDKIRTVKIVLHDKNVLRADIIKKVKGDYKLAPFSYSKKWTKGHAEFWGIDPEYISWENLGSITLKIKLDTYYLPIELSVETDELDNLVNQNDLTPSGKIRIGKDKGKVIEVVVSRKLMSFKNFYQFYIIEKQKIEEHVKEFNKLQEKLGEITTYINKFTHEEDIKKLYEILPKEEKIIHNKDHPRFIICFFSRRLKIRPRNNLIFMLYESIFRNKTIDVIHVGIKVTDKPICFGNLNFFNEVDLSSDFIEFSENFLNIVQDAESKKIRLLFEYCYCEICENSVNNKFVKDMFYFIKNRIIVMDLIFEFQNKGVCEKENVIDFKSADAFTPKLDRFVNNRLIPSIDKYMNDDGIQKFCILYGIEDNGIIRPLYHFTNDYATTIEEKTNQKLKELNLSIKAYPIPFKGEALLAIFLVPILN